MPKFFVLNKLVSLRKDDTIVFPSYDRKYYTASDWLVPGNIKSTTYKVATVLGKRHTGEGGHCVQIP